MHAITENSSLLPDNKAVLPNVQQSRLQNLDYLRGLAAFGIMIYHFSVRAYGGKLVDEVMPSIGWPGAMLSRIGIYGVCLFYVLSGLTLYHVYFHKMQPTLRDIACFAQRRFFRIYPLLWIVTLLSVVLSKEPIFSRYVVGVMSGMFGFVKWRSNIPLGVWSIGNEMVFYVFFPLLVLIAKKSKALLAATGVLLFSLFVYFAFVGINLQSHPTQIWGDYTNPLNHVFLFFAGFTIGLLSNRFFIKNSILLAVLSVTLCAFAFFPASAVFRHMISGYNRLYFSLCCFSICLCCYKITATLPKVIHKPLALLGEASYSVYMLHPLVREAQDLIIKWAHLQTPVFLQVAISIAVTLILSCLSYTYFEKYFMRLGRNKGLFAK